jgi:hypothetical protein
MLQKRKSKLFQFGYAKIESLAAFITAVVILILASFIVYNAYQRIANPVPVQNAEITMLALAVAGSISLHLAFKVGEVAKNTIFCPSTLMPRIRSRMALHRSLASGVLLLRTLVFPLWIP